MKELIKDALSRLRQAAGLPHNKTRAQRLAAENEWRSSAVEQQRIAVIAQVTNHPAETVAGWLATFETPAWDELQTSQRWYHLGGRTMNLRDRKSLYALVRAVQPHVAVETGTAGGASSAVILAASPARLYSIDLQKPHASRYGELIPAALRPRWELRLQPGHDILPTLWDELPGPLGRWWARAVLGVQAVLPGLLAELDTIDFFLHDSRHTFRHMTWEYELAWQHLAPGGCLSSHDVAATSAFDDFCRAHAAEIAASGVIASLGFVIKQK
jgi:hypothetical protein